MTQLTTDSPTPRAGRKPRLLDAFCCAGGVTRGYQQAGFEVVGVDLRAWDGYCGDDFVQGDAIEYIREHGHEYDAIQACPPCQDRIAITAGNRKRDGWTDDHVNLVPPARDALAEVRRRVDIPTVMECGVGKHLRRDLMLCGEMFGLGVLRHRWFEIDGVTMPPPRHLRHRGKVRGWRHGEYFDGPYVAAYGKGGGKATVAEMQQAMGIDWIHDHEALREALPPAYSRYIGERLLEQMAVAA